MDSSKALTKYATRQRSLFKRNELAQPFLKWAGGKRQLLPQIRKYIPKTYNRYYEPFVGAGALLFDLQPQEALINDTNEELINCYRVIKSFPEELIRLAHKHQKKNNKDYFYQVRSLDRGTELEKLSEVERAARIIYLNKTCYNGLFRVNSKGQLNVPYGYRNNPQIVDDDVVRAVSNYLNEAHVEIRCGGFEAAVSNATHSDFVYFDPPYDPLSQSASFTSYSLKSFGKREQERLRKVCDALNDRGCLILLSNSATDFVRTLYSDKSRYVIKEVKASRNINSVSTGRGKISELLILNKYNVV